MGNYVFFKLYQLDKDHSDELSSLKSHYNSFATYINHEWPQMSDAEREEITKRINELNDKIKNYN